MAVRSHRRVRLASCHKSILGSALVWLPALLLGALLWSQGVDVPYWDEWKLVTLFDKAQAGQLGLTDFWHQHLEHRHFFATLALFALGHATRWNVRAEYALSFALALLAFLALRSSTACPRQGARHSAMTLAALQVFSLAQFENWLWGWQVSVMLCLFMVYAAAAMLARGGHTGLVGAIAATTIASFSFGSGLAAWPAFLAPLLLQARRGGRVERAHAAVWGLSGAIVLAVYFRGWERPGARGAPLELADLPDVAHYALVFLGSPVSRWGASTTMAAAAGCGVVVAVATLLLRLRRVASRSETVWGLGLPLFALAGGAITGFARHAMGPEQALASRYVTFGGCAWVAVALLIHSPRLPASTVRRSAITLLYLLFVASWLAHLPSFRKHHQVRSVALEALAKNQLGHPALAHLFPRRQTLVQRAGIARRLKLGPYRPGREALAGAWLERDGTGTAVVLGSRRVAVHPSRRASLRRSRWVGAHTLELTGRAPPAEAEVLVFHLDRLVARAELPGAGPPAAAPEHTPWRVRAQHLDRSLVAHHGARVLLVQGDTAEELRAQPRRLRGDRNLVLWNHGRRQRVEPPAACAGAAEHPRGVLLWTSLQGTTAPRVAAFRRGRFQRWLPENLWQLRVGALGDGPCTGRVVEMVLDVPDIDQGPLEGLSWVAFEGHRARWLGRFPASL